MNSYIFSNGAFPDVVNTPATVSQQKIQTIMSYALDFLIGIILQHKQSNELVLFLRIIFVTPAIAQLQPELADS